MFFSKKKLCQSLEETVLHQAATQTLCGIYQKDINWKDFERNDSSVSLP